MIKLYSSSFVRIKRANLTLRLNLRLNYSSKIHPLFGFECVNTSDKDNESSFLESSFASGCKFLLTSSPSVSAHELFADLVLGEEIQPKEITIGHKLNFKPSNQTSSSVEDEDLISREIKIIEKIENILAFSKREKALDFISVPLTLESSTVNQIVSIISEKFESDIGFEFSTELIYKLDTFQIQKIIDNLTPLVEKRNKCPLLIATNIFTASQSAQIYSWARKNANVITIATDTLRCHPQRPSLFNMNDPKLSHHVSASAEEEENINSEIKTLLMTFQKAMDSCMKIEKQFIEKIQKETSIKPTDICFAHILANAQNNIIFPEEWEFIERNHVMPKLNENIQILRKLSTSAWEWSMIYHPMAKILFKSYSMLLEAKKQDILNPAIKDLTSKRDNNQIFVHEYLKLIASFRPNIISLQGMKIPVFPDSLLKEIASSAQTRSDTIDSNSKIAIDKLSYLETLIKV